MEEKELDYLQVFTIQHDEGTKKLSITRSQEQPQHQETVSVSLNDLNMETGFSGKLWVIDDGDNQTMLFPDDY